MIWTTRFHLAIQHSVAHCAGGIFRIPCATWLVRAGYPGPFEMEEATAKCYKKVLGTIESQKENRPYPLGNIRWSNTIVLGSGEVVLVLVVFTLSCLAQEDRIL